MKVGVIGCGKRSATFTQAMVDVSHDIELVGSVDLFQEAADAHKEQFGGGAFTDVDAMLQETQPEFVSIITRPEARLEPISKCITAGVKGVHCEKPMAISLGEAREIHKQATDAGVQVTFSHQRRYLPKAEKAKELINDGAIGKLNRIESACDNFYDWGTHWFDMMFWLNNETPATRVYAQADRKDPRILFDQPIDSGGIACVQYENDVKGVLYAGDCQPFGCQLVIHGEDGTITLSPDGDAPLTVRTKDGEYDAELSSEMDGGGAVVFAVKEALRTVSTDEVNRLDSRFALAATELIFATYRSSMDGRPIDLPCEDDLSLKEAFQLS